MYNFLSQISWCILNMLGVAVQVYFTYKSCISSYFRATLQLHNSPVDYAGKLFKPSKDLASLLDDNEKIICRFWVFVGDVVSGVGLGGFWPSLSGLSILLKFLLETRLKSKSCKPLNYFLVFLVKKLWPK